METFKSILFTIVIVVLLFFLGYWAFSTIESGSAHIKNQELQDLKDKNEELLKENIFLKNEINILMMEEKKSIIEEKPQENVKVTVLKYQNTINDLQKLIDNNILLKRKSLGPDVGIIQKFLNIFNNTSNRIDNDYGAKTETAIKDFQKKQNLTINGETGENTLRKMIEWLEKR